MAFEKFQGPRAPMVPVSMSAATNLDFRPDPHANQQERKTHHRINRKADTLTPIVRTTNEPRSIFDSRNSFDMQQ